MPGPGSYINELNLVGLNKESFSKKGYGNGFLSRIQRFKEDKGLNNNVLPTSNIIAYFNSVPN